MVIKVKSHSTRYMMEKSENSENSADGKKDEQDSPYSDGAPDTAVSFKIQEFVGNCKEFRVDNNKTHLKIVGNCNKIRLKTNNGHLEVVGNSTRVKIVKNSGTISYTGNSGKVYLGQDSVNKNVDYIGNSGILKVVPESSLNIDCKKRTPTEPCQMYEYQLGNERTSDKQQGASSTVKIQGFNCMSTKINFEPNGSLCLRLDNNIPIPTVNISNRGNGNSTNHSGGVSNSVRIANSAGDIVVNNFYRL